MVTRVLGPPHLASLVDAGQTIDEAFEGSQDRIEPRPLAREDSRHEAPERHRHGRDRREEQQDLEPPVECHGQNFSGRSIA